MAANTWNGLICVCKEAGYTSSDVVARLRGILKQKKIGHTGTLDPQAVGVLVVCLGSATRVTDLLTEHDKEYIATVQLGVTTDTQDMTGEILSRGDVSRVTRQSLMEALQAFKGTYDQIPPMYSAVRVGGKHLYELARKGQVVERKPRSVTIHAISLLDDSTLAEHGVFTMEVKCSRGTYIRTLCNDIGERLGCGAAMAQLTRTSVGSFRLEDALTLERIEQLRDEGTLAEHILPVENLFRDLAPVCVSPELRKKMENGNSFRPEEIVDDSPEGEDDPWQPQESYTEGERVRAYCGGDWFGVYRYSSRRQTFDVEKFFYIP